MTHDAVDHCFCVDADADVDIEGMKAVMITSMNDVFGSVSVVRDGFWYIILGEEPTNQIVSFSRCIWALGIRFGANQKYDSALGT